VDKDPLQALIDAVAPLMNRDTVQPFASAWEIDTHDGADGERLYDRLRAAWEAAKTVHDPVIGTAIEHSIKDPFTGDVTVRVEI
jgi:hypothetical protein